MNHDTWPDYERVQLGWRGDLADLIDDFRRRFQAAPAEAAKRWELAPKSCNTAELIAIGTVLRENGRMDHKVQLRLAAALLVAHLGAEACEVLKTPIGPNRDSPNYWDLRVRALVRTSALDAAAACLRKGQHVAPAPRLRRLGRALERIRAAAASFATMPEFHTARSWLDGLMALEARSAAGKAAFATALARPALRADALADAIAVARQALTLLGPGKARPLVEQVIRDGGDSEAVAALAVDFEALAAEPPRTRLRRPDLVRSSDRTVRSALASSYWAQGEREKAIETLGPLVDENASDFGVSATLAYYIGQQRLAETGFRFGPPARAPRVFNVVIFSHEYVLTKMRLAEMADWVDQFIFVEAGQTFTGRPKPLRFEQFRSEIASFDDKVSHIKIEAFPSYLTSIWSRELYQRDTPLEALNGVCAPNDIVIITDADEIVHRRALSEFPGGLSALRMRVHRYFFNYAPLPSNPQSRHASAVMATAEHVGRLGCSYLRLRLGPYGRGWHTLSDAGWHFTSTFDAAGIAEKFQGYSHQERSKSAMRDERRVEQLLQRLRSGEYDEGWTRAEIDEGLPAYIVSHREELAPFLI